MHMNLDERWPLGLDREKLSYNRPVEYLVIQIVGFQSAKELRGLEGQLEGGSGKVRTAFPAAALRRTTAPLGITVAKTSADLPDIVPTFDILVELLDDRLRSIRQSSLQNPYDQTVVESLKMAKSKNSSQHNQAKKAHKNGYEFRSQQARRHCSLRSLSHRSN
ncbi:hypothetical protein CLAIMM_00306 isoform 1 [Cladophialophora immunda]|nr:hypothetical protein CLAIMM_00306 isoform 1 [Cladophialophora immunda]